ncbi:hypothetical protein D3C73_1351510 [compost metagenome]
MKIDHPLVNTLHYYVGRVTLHDVHHLMVYKPILRRITLKRYQSRHEQLRIPHTHTNLYAVRFRLVARRHDRGMVSPTINNNYRPTS